LPTNAAVITGSEIAASMGKGVLIVGMAFALGGVYLGFRTFIHRRREQ
jgi:Ca2+/H+ antiporter